MQYTIFLLLLAGLPLAAQSVPVGFAGAGYRNPPSIVEAAPGQVLVVSVNGAQARLAEPVQGKPDVTTEPSPVGGFSVDLVQTTGRTPALLYGVSQTPCAIPSSACVPVTNLTVVVPFTLVDTPISGVAALEVKENGRTFAAVPVRAVTDKVHIISSCDDSVVYYSVFGGEDLTQCTAAVVRPRGGLIKPGRPVSPGEQLVAFGYGMGDTNPHPAQSGPFVPALTKQPFILRYAVAGGPVFWAQAPDGVALQAAAGTYQVHFTVPPLPDNTPLPACGERGLYGNLTVTISGIHSTDRFELCVTP
jgi:uncharacterized protein (TIGR03437 family)